MQSDYRVKKLVTEEGGDVVAICYDVLYGETFEKYIGIPEDFDARENASNLLQDSNYEISDEVRAELESTFGISEFDDDQDYDGYQFYDFGDEDEDIYVNIKTKEEYTMSPTNDGRIRLYSLSDDSGKSDITISEDEFYKNYEYVESEEKIDDLVYAGNANGISTDESFSLREALNTIDIDTYNKYDLLNLYESCNLSENEKRALANIVYDQNDPSVIYDTLNDRFLGKEIEMPERVKDGVIHEDTTDRPVEFKAGYHEWNVLLNGEIIYSFGDFGETLEGCTDKDTLGYEVEDCIQVMLDELNESGKNIQLTNGEFDALKNQMVAKLGYHYLDLDESKYIKEEYAIFINDEVCCDTFGEPYHFNSQEEAEEFISDRELENAEIVRQYGKSKTESKSIKEEWIETSKGKVFLDVRDNSMDGVFGDNVGFEINPTTNDVSFFTLDKGETIKKVKANSLEDAKKIIKDIIENDDLDKYNINESLNESSAKTFSQWFDETNEGKYDKEWEPKYYPFTNYIKTFPNAEVLKDATAEDIKNNAHRFYDLWDVDSADREHAFTFASEELGIDYDTFYYAWLYNKPIKGVNESVDEFEFDDEFNAYYDGYTSELTDEEKYLLLMAQDMGEYGDNSYDYDDYEDEVRRVETKAEKIAKAKGMTIDDYISILNKNFDYNLKDGSYKFNESKESDDTLANAVELLYIMDKFVLDVYDNEGWLMNGIPDGEFNESSAESAKQNWKDHSWLVIDENGNANLDDFREFIDVFRRCTRSKNYDQEERDRIIAEAESLLHN